jgi:hypothetical protein
MIFLPFPFPFSVFAFFATFLPTVFSILRMIEMFLDPHNPGTDIHWWIHTRRGLRHMAAV